MAILFTSARKSVLQITLNLTKITGSLSCGCSFYSILFTFLSVHAIPSEIIINFQYLDVIIFKLKTNANTALRNSTNWKIKKNSTKLNKYPLLIKDSVAEFN